MFNISRSIILLVLPQKSFQELNNWHHRFQTVKLKHNFNNLIRRRKKQKENITILHSDLFLTTLYIFFPSPVRHLFCLIVADNSTSRIVTF